MQQSLTYVSLFSASGLGCHGFKLEDYTCVATAELLSRRLEVQKVNNTCSDPGAYYLGDLSDHKFLTRISNDVKARTNDLTFVLATPPCQGMSVANHKKGDELGRNSLVVNSLEFIKTTKPRFFVLENVRAFLTSYCEDTDGRLKTIDDAIDCHLGGSYNILKRVVNLKNYGSPSSRTRTLVIGSRNDLHDITPHDLFPDKVTPPTLSELIQDLPSLTEMGEISPEDIYHSFRSYDPRMREWISGLAPGESAFDNTNPVLRPHRIIAGKRVENKNGNGDKYKRNVWDKVAPCVHTRNDILASQSTIHPSDDRVFSIRELSRMMGVPDSFRWANFDLTELNALPLEQKQAFIKEHDTNIRQCLGEGVPTPVIKSIANKAKNLLAADCASKFSLSISAFENSNPRKKELSAHYTRQDIAFSLLSLVKHNRKKSLRILEPSVGAGSFVPQIIHRFHEASIELDVVDIDEFALTETLKNFAEMKFDTQVSIKRYHDDFLKMEFPEKYDLVVGNPPFGSSGKVTGPFNLKDLYAKFIARSLEIGTVVAFVIPKSFLAGKEFQALRSYISSNYRLIAIEDYGETAFTGIKIETIGIVIGAKSDKHTHTTVRSRLFNTLEFKLTEKIVDPAFPSWLLYRDWYFDSVSQQLDLNCFTSYRDRSITKAKLTSSGDIPVFKAKNIDAESADSIRDYCGEDLVPRAFWKATQHRDCLVVPNLSYYPRAGSLPDNTYVDGSAAVLIPKIELDTERAKKFFRSADFFYYYRIARNFSVRSLNIDAISVHYWGVPKTNYSSVLPEGTLAPSSKTLFTRLWSPGNSAQ